MRLTSPDDLKTLGTILCVFAHPDDETFSMGGILAAAAKNGQEIVVVTATRGEGGVQDESRWPAAQLGAIRTAELQAALDILGVHQHHFLDYADGSCQSADADAAAEKIADLIEQYRPDSIFTFGPDGMTGHADHRTVSAWTDRARQLAGSTARLFHAVISPEQYEGFREADSAFNFFFNTMRPPITNRAHAAIYLTLDDSLYQQKIQALKAMPSQYEKLFERFDGKLRGGFGEEVFIEK